MSEQVIFTGGGNRVISSHISKRSWQAKECAALEHTNGQWVTSSLPNITTGDTKEEEAIYRSHSRVASHQPCSPALKRLSSVCSSALSIPVIFFSPHKEARNLAIKTEIAASLYMQLKQDVGLIFPNIYHVSCWHYYSQHGTRRAVDLSRESLKPQEKISDSKRCSTLWKRNSMFPLTKREYASLLSSFRSHKGLHF